jgi:broad specificity phosphatase PhoE
MAGVALLAPPSAWGQGTVVYLVRHAEKEAEPAADPPLTAEGQARARALAHALADAGLTAIWSSDYARTRDTAVPVAEGTGLDVQLYDPRDLPGFASALRAQAGRFLVVGHSNTTPALVAMLGGEPGQPIDEPSEYDRLYVLVINGGVTTTTLLRFGEPSPGR